MNENDLLENQPYVTKYSKQVNDKIKCLICRHNCTLSEGKMGICKTREVVNGELISHNYGQVSSISLNPIEKKPLYHFHPGSYATTIGSWSCNFSCPWCQNYSLTKVEPKKFDETLYLYPEKLVEIIIQNSKSSGVSFSFNEPTLMAEYTIDVMKLLAKSNPAMYSGYVTNGYMSEEVLNDLIRHGLDTMTVSFKGGKENMKMYCNANTDYIFENISRAFEKDLHLEIVVLVIPTISDSDEYFDYISKKLVNDYSPDIPLHFNAYYPAHKFHLPRTDINILEKARTKAMENGLNYVYIGNILGHEALNTFCPECQELVIERSQSRFIKNNLDSNNSCPRCSYSIPIT
ncbi:MAG: AmmeMemoRadiSam system radical SAM enzyme [Asgard group archaeon]|nr:AmmeMemoRadiSam system radical SAM enzyme [Asgard group archaeon]